MEKCTKKRILFIWRSTYKTWCGLWNLFRQYYKNFYGCFEDNSGNMLFAEFVDEMDVDAMNDVLQQLQQEIDTQQ